VAPSFFSFERDPHAWAGKPEFQKAKLFRKAELRIKSRANRNGEPQAVSHLRLATCHLRERLSGVRFMYTKMLSLRFPPSAVNEPVITNLIRKFDLECNILKAVIYPRKEGLAVMEVSGHRKNYHKGLHYLRSIGIKVGKHCGGHQEG
jgi:ABC-type methionine transport system ATPase subunit